MPPTVLQSVAGFAQVGVLGDADKEQVRPGGLYLFAQPPGRAVFLAGLGADAGTEVLDAPSGEAVSVVVAGVQEAAAVAHGGQFSGNIRDGEVELDLFDLTHFINLPNVHGRGGNVR